MSTWTKTQGTSLLALQSIASASLVVGSAVDVSSKFAAFIGIQFGRRAVTALTTTGFRIRVEASAKSSGDGFWFTLVEFLTAIATSEAEAVTGTNSAGQPVITVASTTNIAAGAIVFFDNTTIGNSEWGRVKSIVSNTSITLEDNLLNAQNTGASTIYTLAELFSATLDLSAIGRIRVVADNLTTGQAIAVQATLVTGDSIA